MTFEFGGSVVIPTGQYANIQPSFTITAETFEEAKREWLAQAQSLYAAVGKTLHLTFDGAAPKGELLKCWASGTEVYFDEATHTYTSPDGKQDWLSGSSFAKRYVPEFPGEVIADKMAKKARREREEEVDSDEILAMWAKKAEVSSSFGTSLHAALELYGKYDEVSLAVKGTTESAEVANPLLAEAVRSFFRDRMRERAVYEVFVADGERRHCGQIDRLVLNADGSVDLEDYKSNADLVEKKQTILAPFKGLVPANNLGIYTLQLNFYRSILERHGVKVRAITIHHWDGDNWVKYPVDRLDISEAF